MCMGYTYQEGALYSEFQYMVFPCYLLFKIPLEEIYPNF